MNKLSALTFATVAVASRQSNNPSATVRGNGKLMFNDAANKIIGYDGKKADRLFFKLGKIGTAPEIYLVPATATEPNTLHAAKNVDSFQFNDIGTIAALGMQLNTRYRVELAQEDGIEYFVLYPKTADEKQAEDKANKAAHVEPENIKAKMERSVAPLPKAKPTGKELEAAAIKAAKADFKKSK